MTDVLSTLLVRSTATESADREPLAAPVIVAPLNPVDELCFHLDTERHPWTIELEIRAPGPIDEARLRASVRAAARAHPLARARLRPYRVTDRQYAWEIGADIHTDPVWMLAAADDAAMARLRADVLSAGVPLDDPPPFRVWLVRRPGGDSLLLAVNHVASDGMGALRLLRSIVRAYAGDADPIDPIDPVAHRDVVACAGPTGAVERVTRLAGYGASLRHATGRLSRIAVDGGEATAGGYRFGHVRVPAEDLRGLDAKRFTDATINDLLLAALHLAIDDWNADHLTATDRVSVMMPVNLRPQDRWTDTVGNLSLMVSINTKPGDRAEAASLLDAVARQTSRAKRNGTAAVLLEVLGRSGSLPAIAKQVLPMLSPLTGDRLIDTAVLSNLGRLDECFDFGPGFGPEAGSGLATEVWFSPPARMPLGVGIGAVTHGGDLFLSFRACQAQFDAAALDRFAAGYLRALEFVG